MITAEYIEYMNAYRIYDTEKPQNTMAYVDDEKEAIETVNEENRRKEK